MPRSHYAGHSRPGSSRASSRARDILRQRDNKPYRTEKQKVYSKKRKLHLNTSFKKAPKGYTFVAVGTPDLADKCKELSRQQGFDVYIVNAKPVSKHATDPMKVSHHIHRIGYHFKSEIVTNACIELGYIVHRQQFVKEADLQTKKDHSKLAEIMARRGMTLNQLEMRESPEQVRAAIKELFPKIPDEDLNQIVDHAWKEGSHRVGTNANLQLPRRVQLATIARIRHTYTDYDQLLRAFEWKDARAMVEQACLLKVIEWRGEHDEANDNDLEEIVREIIVLDDDDDENSDAYDEDEADDEDSDAELGFMSDSSVEITHTRLLGKDLTAENMNEGHGTNPYQQPPPPRRRVQQNAMALQRITQTRQQIQTSNVPPQVPPYAQQRIYSPLSLQMKTYSMRDAPNQMTIGGQIFRRVPDRNEPARPWMYEGNTGGQPAYVQAPAARAGEYDSYRPAAYDSARPLAYTDRDAQQERRVTTADYSTYVEVPSSSVRYHAEPHDHPIPSIENNKDAYNTYVQQPPPPVPVSAHQAEVYYAMQNYRRSSQGIVDLTSPPPPARATYGPVHGAPAPVQQVPREGRGYY